MEQRVVITGLGAVTSLGLNVHDFWESLISGRSGLLESVPEVIETLKIPFTAPVKDFEPERYWTKKEIRKLDRFSMFAILAAREALKDAGEFTENDYEAFGVYLGSSFGGASSTLDNIQKLVAKGPSRMQPLFIPTMLNNMAASNIAMDLALKGSVQTFSTSCCASNDALGHAFLRLKHNEMSSIVVGGSESCINPAILGGFNNLHALSLNPDIARASIPFDKERSGFVMGEGAAMMILETLDHALNRGAHIYGEIVGYGASNDAYHLTAPDTKGYASLKAMNEALDMAHLTPQDLTYINAHGTGTPINDKIETLVYKQLLGKNAKTVWISSIKSSIGHLLGASGAVEALATIKAIETSVIPQTINHKVADPECDLNYVFNEAKACQVNCALSHSLGFGGQNSTLIFKRFTDGL